MTDLAKLADAIEAADADAGTITNARLALEQQLREIAQREAVALARADGLRHALFLINGEAKAPEPVAPVEKPKEPRYVAADEILDRYPDNLPDGIDDLFADLHDVYNARTLRSALNIAHQRRPNQHPATEPLASGQAAQHRPGIQEAPGNSADGAGPADSFPDIPANLRRAPTRTAAE